MYIVFLMMGVRAHSCKYVINSCNYTSVSVECNIQHLLLLFA